MRHQNNADMEAIKQTNILLWIVLLITLLVGIGQCSKANAEDICFGFVTAQKLEVFLKQGDICKDQLQLYTDLEETNTKEILLLKDKFVISNQTITNYQNELEKQETECDARVSASKQGFFTEFLSTVTKIGIGVAVGALAAGIILSK